MRASTAGMALTLALVGCGGDPVSDDERAQAIDAATAAFAQAQAAGTNLSNGPCIADPLADQPDWVVDIAHDPRSEADDDPDNQCSAYRDGEASHFIELGLDGELIRAQ